MCKEWAESAGPRVVEKAATLAQDRGASKVAAAAAAAAEPLTFRIWSVPSRSTRLIVVEDAIKGLIRLQLSYGDIPQPFKCLAFTTSRTTDFVAEARQKNGAERHRVDGRRPDIFATFVSSALPHTLLCLATS